MAFATLKLKSKNGAVKEAPVGFSWTVFFLSFWVPLTRGDWMWALIMLVAIVITFGFAGILFAFIYNRLYLEGLLKQGYTIKSYSGDKRSIESSAQIKLSSSSRQVQDSSSSDAKFESAYSETTTSRSNSPKASSSNDFTDELEELQELYEDGTLSMEQFKKAKKKLLT